jgi:class 3 adenylate cyclase
MWGPDTLPERLEIARETSVLAEEAGDTVLQWEAQVFLIGDLLEGGDIAAADEEIARFAAATHALPIPYHVWFLRVIEAMRMLVRGEFEAAGRRALEALTAGQEAQNQSALLAYGAQFALIRRELGMSEGLVEGATGFIEQFPTIPAWRCARAYYHSDAGHDEEAARDVDVLAADGFAGIPRDMFWFTSMTLLSQAVANLGDGERAAAMYDLLAPYADRYSVVAPCATTYGSVERNLGLLAATLGRADDAVRHLRAAVTRNAAIGARGWVAHCQADLGRLLLDRGAPGDQHEALEMLGAALDTARALKMAGLIEEVLALKLEAQGVDVAEPQTSIDAVVASVEAVRPDLRSHAAADGTVTLLFSDIENSTLMTEALGDARWLELLQAHNRIVREEVRAHRGFEVKSQGDGFMLAFSSASRALLCAVGIQRGVRAHGERFPDQSLQVRIGLHTGEAIRAGDDFFGRNVVLAARVAEQARGSEILVSAPLKELVESSARWTFAAAREVELKGLAGRHRVYAIEWQPEVATTAP